MVYKEQNECNYSILIPAYNAAGTLGQLIEKIVKLKPAPQDILVVNDGSADNTSKIARNAQVNVIDHNSNHGKGKALRSGFKHYIGQNYQGFILCLDADLQHPPEYIKDFLDYAQKTDFRFIIGTREKKIGQMPWHRILSNRITSLIISLITGQKIYDSQCGFRLIDIEVIKNLELSEDGFQLESEMILKAAKQGIKIGFVPIPVVYNQAGSHIGNVADTLKFVWLVVRYLVRKVTK